MEEKNENIIEKESISHFIKTIIKKYNELNYIRKMTGKNLHYLNKTIIRFFCIIKKSNEFNPFDSDICISFEFIEEITPYICILNDFITPSLNDGRNIFYCLTNQHNYIFSKNILNKLENLFDNLMEGLKNFLLCLKENNEINAFIFYGEYSLSQIYQINDFIINKNTIKLFRITKLNEKNKGLKYIVITQLYFLIFKPLDEDMSLVKLEQFFYLKDIDGDFNILNKKNKGKFILKLIDKKTNKEIIIEFIFNENLHDKLNNNDGNNEENKFCDLKNTFITKKNEINFKKYKTVIINYKPLFAIDIHKKNKSHTQDNKEIDYYSDYKLYIEYYEALIEYYKNIKDENMNERLKKYYDYLTYCCVDFISFNSSNTKEANLFYSKIIKYMDINKNK